MTPIANLAVTTPTANCTKTSNDLQLTDPLDQSPLVQAARRRGLRREGAVIFTPLPSKIQTAMAMETDDESDSDDDSDLPPVWNLSTWALAQKQDVVELFNDEPLDSTFGSSPASQLQPPDGSQNYNNSVKGNNSRTNHDGNKATVPLGLFENANGKKNSDMVVYSFNPSRLVTSADLWEMASSPSRDNGITPSQFSVLTAKCSLCHRYMSFDSRQGHREVCSRRPDYFKLVRLDQDYYYPGRYRHIVEELSFLFHSFVQIGITNDELDFLFVICPDKRCGRVMTRTAADYHEHSQIDSTGCRITI